MILRLRFTLAALLQAAIILGIIGMRIVLLNNGQPIRLRTEPVELDDLVRGGSLALPYEIAQLQVMSLPGDDQFELQDAVYVKLDRVPARYWVPESLHREPPPTEGYEAVIKGVVVDLKRLENIPPPVQITKEITVRYGIESFVVPEGVFTSPSSFGSSRARLTVEAVVDGEGNAAVAGLRKGRQCISEPLYLRRLCER